MGKPGSSAPEEEDFSHLIDQGAVNILQQSLPQLMVNSPKLLADQFLEMISLMGKRWVQDEWPNLIPVSFTIFLRSLFH